MYSKRDAPLLFHLLNGKSMSNIQNLTSEEAVEKLKALAKSADICLFTTALTVLPLSTRPMSVSQVDEFGNLWFLSNKSSDKNLHIKNDKRVQLFFSNTSKAEFLSVYGDATVFDHNRAKAEELWNAVDKVWFPGGLDDPELTVICVAPQEAYYWDTKHNKAITFFNILAKAVTGGNGDEEGVQGHISVQGASI
ncbi:general stress protein [Filimonas lacunae]|nr:general stress protein [Filimonas lacunae]